MNDKPSRMDYRQHQAARRLVHECCNYDEGNCLLLDDGEPCVCVQSISYSLMCAGSVWLSCTSEHRSMYSYVRLSIDRCTATYV